MFLKDLNDIRNDAKNYNVPILAKEKAQWLLEFIETHTPQKILELGTAIGYSGIILCSQGANLTSIELSARDIQRGRKNFKKFNLTPTLIYGDALVELPKLVQFNRSFDLIFIDFICRSYFDALENCISLTSEGGYIIADNVNTEKAAPFKEAILNHPKLETQILEIGDGVSVSRKLL